MAEKKPLAERVYELKRAEREAKDRLQRERSFDVRLQPASEVKREKLKTYFGGRLVEGAFQMMVGPGEAGKGMVSTDIVARLSTGDAFPGERVGREPMSVLVCVTEDSKERMRGRLEAAGADLGRVFFMDGPEVMVGGLLVPSPVALGSEAGAVVREAKRVGAGALFLETMLEHLADRDGGNKQWSSNNEFDVRRAVSPVIALCKEARLVGWGVMHPRKSAEGGIEDSISGSAAFRNISRGVLHVYKDPVENGSAPWRLFLCSKANYLARRPDTLRFRVESWDQDPDEGRVVWGVEGRTLVDERSAEDVWAQIHEARKNKNRKDHSVVSAEEFLRELLPSGVLVPYDVVTAAVQDAGLSESTLKRARINLNVEVIKEGFPAKVVGWRLTREEGEM